MNTRYGMVTMEQAIRNFEKASRKVRKIMDGEQFIDLAIIMYADEPCRICGQTLTLEDIKAGAVFAGYSADRASRSAHKHCWDNALEIMREMFPGIEF